MSSGQRGGDEPAPVSAVVRLLQNNPGLRRHLSRPKIVNRDYRVPYLAGSSIDGWTTYIDSQAPDVLSKSGIRPADYYPMHEKPEWWLMTQLGMKYYPLVGRSAHKLAHGIERYTMKLDGISDERIEQYEKESAGLVNLDEHVKLPPEAFPPDLYLGPYQASEDSDKAEDAIDKKLLPLLRQAQMRRIYGFG